MRRGNGYTREVGKVGRGSDMFVRDLMTRDVTTLQANDELTVADDVMRLGRIRHMPVLDDEERRVVGIVSQRDLFRGSLVRAFGYGEAAQRRVMKTIPVKEVMSSHVVTIGSDAPLAEAARLMVERKIGCLPVVDDMTYWVALAVLLSACFLLGFLTQTTLGSVINAWLERTIFDRLPGYRLARNLTHGISGSDANRSFPAALVRLQDGGAEAMALVVERNADGSYTVFVPLAPTPHPRLHLCGPERASAHAEHPRNEHAELRDAVGSGNPRCSRVGRRARALAALPSAEPARARDRAGRRCLRSELRRTHSRRGDARQPPSRRGEPGPRAGDPTPS